MAEFKHQIPISAPAEKVYAALATSTGLKAGGPPTARPTRKWAAKRSSASTGEAWFSG